MINFIEMRAGVGWQANGDSWKGEMPDQDPGLPGSRLPWPALPGGFGHGGPWEAAAPSAALALALEHAAGPEGRYPSAGTDALVGIARQWAALESWAAAGKLAALRAMVREDADGTPRLRRRPDLPDGWDDSLTYEISGALAMGPVSADNLASLAWTMGARLAGTGRLLADGTLTMAKAKLIAQLFEPLDEQEAARAEALILDELAGKTYPQVEKLAWRAALAVAPDAAERRRRAGEKQARVTVFREDSGAVGLSGRDLPAAAALAGHANVVARASEYEASGAFPGQGASRLQALAYTDLLNGISTRDRIAFARTAAADPPAGYRPENGNDGDGDKGGPGPSGHDGGGGHNQPSGRDGSGASPGGDEHSPGEPSGGGHCEPDSSDETGPDSGESGSDGPDDARAPGPALAELTVPLATLQGRAEHAGDNRLLGPLDPALTRDLAAAAARSPASRWEITIVGEHGHAVGHSAARPQRGARASPRPPAPPASSALPARVNITITETFLHQLQTQSLHPLQAQAGQPRPGAPSGDWALTPANPGTLLLTLPGGRKLAVRFDVVPVYGCDHRYRVSSYLPGDRLRRLVQVRDHECTWPPCSRPARESDFEHAIPYGKGGATCACNAGARSRRCHRVKQLPGWTVAQPRPGWHVWTTPTGRTYTQEPWRYTA